MTELEMLRLLEDAVRAMMDEAEAIDRHDVITFPVAHYVTVQVALDTLDQITGRHQY